jgi:predicted ATP-grasp superfamily ATP-dependent carboligase
VRIFIYEFLTAQGVGQSPKSPDHGMYLEGRAMRDAVVEDFARIPGTDAFSFPDDAAPISRESFEELCGRSDWTLLIAPAFNGCLTQLAESVLRVGGRLLGSSVDAIQLTSDKFSLFNRWGENNIPTPATTEREPTACEAFPVVWKPRDGAGSTATFFLNSANDVVRAKAVVAAENYRGPMILQQFVPGQAASIAFLCGPNGNLPLLPASQSLSDDGRFYYRGGEIPFPPELARRAVRLGQQAVDCVPALRGFIGVDLVLGSVEDGTQDYAIEINPRLTTSYVGLRSLADFNLAEAMLHAATDGIRDPLKFKADKIRFRPNGVVEERSSGNKNASE